ncbi:COMPASS (complex proteins associated with Set1p) component [Mactra antiquata]
MMVQCDFCDGWFHPRCVDLDEDDAKNSSRWNCPGCVEVMIENPSLTRKSLLAFQGHIAPKTGWGQDLLVTDIDERVLDEKI